MSQKRYALIVKKRLALRTPKLSEFETLCAAAGLETFNALVDPNIVRWIRANYWRKFIPEPVLESLGLNVEQKLELSMGMGANNNLVRGYRNHGLSYHHQSSLQRESL